VNVEFQSAGMDNLSLGYHTEINLYRVIKEGLNNIWKHANAKNANFKIISSFPNILLRIEDNGRGFDVDSRLLKTLSEKRMGLKSMEERVALLQGKMSI
jgi:signal transduction histidine kinase